MLVLDDVKRVNEELNGYLDLTIVEWGKVEERKIEIINKYMEDVRKIIDSGISSIETQKLLQDAEDMRDFQLETLTIKEEQLSKIARHDLAQKVKELKEKVKAASKYKDPFTKSFVTSSAEKNIESIKEVLRAEKTLYNKLADIGEKIWSKTVAPLIEAIKSPDNKLKKAAAEKGAHMVTLARKYSTAVKGAFTKIGDFSKSTANNFWEGVKYLDAKCREVDKHDIMVDVRDNEKKLEHLEDKLIATVHKKLAIQDEAIAHERKRWMKKGILIEGPIKKDTPTIDKKIAKIQKKILECQEKLVSKRIEYYEKEAEQESIVDGTKYEGSFRDKDSYKAEKLARAQLADLRAQFDNASDFDIAMAGVLRVNDKVMETMFAEKVAIKGEEVPVYRVVIDSNKVCENNILNPRVIANLSADERIYPTNQGYSYLYTTDPERAVEWGQEFSKRGVLHDKGVECSSEKAKELFSKISNENKELGITNKQKKSRDDGMSL